MKRKFWLILYYGFARYLPPTHKGLLGLIGSKLRRTCAMHLFKSCASDVNIEHMADFGNGAGIEIGSRSGIGIHCHVPNDIKIGDCVLMGPYCHILNNTSHNYSRNDIPIIDQGVSKIKKRTIIGNDVWMGRQCLMVSGKTIGNHTIIGAGSVVCKDIPDNVVAAGNPIRIVKQR